MATARPGSRQAAGGALTAMLAALVLGLAWAETQPKVPDISAQLYRIHLFEAQGFSIWDPRWYSGHDLPAYSLISPALGSLIGLWAMGVIAALCSTVLFTRLVVRAYGPAASWSGPLFALGAVGDLWSGRVTFALAVPFGLAAILVLAGREQEGPGAGALLAGFLLAVLCAAASPVAGALLAMSALIRLAGSRPAGLVLLAGVAIVLVPLEILFPEGGTEPFPVRSFAVAAAVTVGFLLAVSRVQRRLRAGALLYLCALVASLLIPTPMGSNAERYGVLLAGPLLLALLCAELRARARDGRFVRAGWIPGGYPVFWRPPGRGIPPRSDPPWGLGRYLALLVICGATLWVIWGPVRETRAVAGEANTSASYYRPLLAFLDAHGGSTVRVEVPFTRTHWEADLLASHVSLARGWEKQLDTRYDRALLQPGLTPGRYRAWLKRNAVSYVALPDAAPDPSSAQESALIRRGLPYLREVLHSSHWRIYRVTGATPIVSGPARLRQVGRESLRLHARRPGRILVRVHYSPYLTLTEGSGCVREAGGGWTLLRARAAGPITLAARFSLSRGLRLTRSCSP